jgi:methylmalonyl-CoA/ethylmalonyl-CoA epimerase
MTFDSNKIIQVSIVVNDIEKTANNIAKLFGMDLPEIFPMEKLGELYAEFKGEPTTASIKIANFEMGNMTLELIEPDEKPSSFRDFLDENGEGVHHIGFVVDDLDGAKETLSENGIGIRHWGTYPGGSYYIADTKDFIGAFLNIKHLDE